MRGQMSNGMCCSAAEIGLGDDHDGIMILSGDAATSPSSARRSREALGIETDVLWDLEVNANRPDAMSVAGVARDLAAALGVPFALPRAHDRRRPTTPSPTIATVEIVDPTLCGRFVARVLRDVTVGESPAVDAESARPPGHAPDQQRRRHLQLRDARARPAQPHLRPGDGRRRRTCGCGGPPRARRIVTLDDVERTLDPVRRCDRRRRRRGHRPRRRHGRCLHRDLRVHDRRPARDGVVGSAVDLPHGQAAATCPARHRPGSGAAPTGATTSTGPADRFVALLAESGATCAAGQIDERGTLPDRSAAPRARPTKVNGLLGTDLDRRRDGRHSSSRSASRSTSVGRRSRGRRSRPGAGTPTTETDVAEEVGPDVRLREHRAHRSEGRRGRRPDATTSRSVGSSARRWSAPGCDETLPMPFLGARRPRCGRAARGRGDARRTRWCTRSRCCGRRCCPVSSRRLRTTSRTGARRPLLRDRPCVPAAAKAMRCCPTSASTWPWRSPASDAPAAVDDARPARRRVGAPQRAAAAAEPAGAAPDPQRRGRHRRTRPRRSSARSIPTCCGAYGVDGRVAWLELDLEAVLEGPHGNRSYTPVQQVSRRATSTWHSRCPTPSPPPRSRGRCARVAARCSSVSSCSTSTGEPVSPTVARSLAYRLRFQATDRTLTDAEVAEVRQACIDTVAKQQGARLR